MANADSNTIARPEIGPTLSTLLKNPLGASHDLFQVLEGCQGYVDELIDNNNLIERMALCGRLLAEDLKAPRFVQTGAGLKMLDGEAVSVLH